MALTVAAQARRQVRPTASVAGRRDGVLHGAVGQPAGVAPVQALVPRREELLKRGQGGVLILARPLGPQEVQAVASFVRVVWKHHTYRQEDKYIIA